jgi:hypothetical protein
MPQSERRAHPRQRKVVRVLIADPADALEEPFPGWIVDRSPGGVCVSSNRSDVEEGNILKVQPISGCEGGPWVEIVVKNRRWKRSRVELGCVFRQLREWEQALLVN